MAKFDSRKTLSCLYWCHKDEIAQIKRKKYRNYQNSEKKLVED